eukprot:3941306-Rhodomonas_salina.3
MGQRRNLTGEQKAQRKRRSSSTRCTPPMHARCTPMHTPLQVTLPSSPRPLDRGRGYWHNDTALAYDQDATSGTGTALDSDHDATCGTDLANDHLRMQSAVLASRMPRMRHAVLPY